MSNLPIPLPTPPPEFQLLAKAGSVRQVLEQVDVRQSVACRTQALRGSCGAASPPPVATPGAATAAGGSLAMMGQLTRAGTGHAVLLLENNPLQQQAMDADLYARPSGTRGSVYNCIYIPSSRLCTDSYVHAITQLLHIQAAHVYSHAACSLKI